MADRVIITPELLRHLLDIEPDTGVMRWKARGPEWFTEYAVNGITRSPQRNANNWNSRYAGKIAASKGFNGYLHISVLSERFLAHRVAFAIYHGNFPTHHVDHIDGDRSNNAAANLRDVSKLENSKNVGLRSDNRSGVVGVIRTPANVNPWHAYIKGGGKKRHIGCYPTLEAATKARKEAEIEWGYHANHGNRPAVANHSPEALGI